MNTNSARMGTISAMTLASIMAASLTGACSAPSSAEQADARPLPFEPVSQESTREMGLETQVDDPEAAPQIIEEALESEDDEGWITVAPGEAIPLPSDGEVASKEQEFLCSGLFNCDVDITIRNGIKLNGRDAFIKVRYVKYFAIAPDGRDGWVKEDLSNERVTPGRVKLWEDERLPCWSAEWDIFNWKVYFKIDLPNSSNYSNTVSEIVTPEGAGGSCLGRDYTLLLNSHWVTN